MGSSLTKCSTSVLGNPGDHTAGIMYYTWVHPSSPLLGYTNFTNYPFGENLWQPLALTSIIPSSLHVLLTYLTNLVCAWNLLVLIGYMGSCLAMFGLIYWLTSRFGISIFAAYAATFTPYHLFASQGQIAGLLNFIFILGLWQFIRLWKSPSIGKALLLGLLFGIGFFTDGYFILIGATMLLSLWISTITGALLIKTERRRIFIKIIPFLTMASVTAAVFLLPLYWVQLRFSSQIKDILGNARGNILNDAQIYSAKPIMYFSRSELIYIGTIIFILSIIGSYFTLRNIYKSKTNNYDFRTNIAGWTSIFLVIVSGLVSLKPIFYIWGHRVYTPSWIIIHFTESWRVFGRLYVLVDTGVVVLAAIGLYYISRKNKKAGQFLLILSFMLLVVDFSILKIDRPIPVYNYTKAPAVYKWLKENKSVKATAEYPLDEMPQGAYLSQYYTFQEISSKPMVNSMLPNSDKASLRRSIAGINDPQTLPILRALGVGVVNIRPAAPNNFSLTYRHSIKNNNELQHIFSYNTPAFWLDSYVIKPGRVTRYALKIRDIKYFQVKVDDYGHAKYMVDNNPILDIEKLPGVNSKTENITVSLVASADSVRDLKITQGSRVLWSGVLRTKPELLLFSASTSAPIRFSNEKNTSPTHIEISQLQIIEK